jgi:hypothetical protein
MRPRIDGRHRGLGEGTLFADEARKRRDDFVYRGHCDSATEVIGRVVPRIGPATFGLFEPAEPALVCIYAAKHALDLAEERTDDPQTLGQDPNQWRVLGMVRLA